MLDAFRCGVFCRGRLVASNWTRATSKQRHGDEWWIHVGDFSGSRALCARAHDAKYFTAKYFLGDLLYSRIRLASFVRRVPALVSRVCSRRRDVVSSRELDPFAGDVWTPEFHAHFQAREVLNRHFDVGGHLWCVRHGVQTARRDVTNAHL